MIRFQQETSTVRNALESLSGLIPIRYRLLLDLLQFFFWAFLWMTFFRVFTFMGYGRAIMDMPGLVICRLCLSKASALGQDDCEPSPTAFLHISHGLHGRVDY